MFRYASLVLLFALASSPGTLLWEVRPGGRDFGGLAESSGILTAGNVTSQGGIFAFSANSGKLLWSHRGEQMHASTVSDGQRTFALFDGDKGRHLVAYDLKTGKQLWTTPIEGHLRTQDPAPVIDSGSVYVLDQGGHLNAYNAVTGATIYRFTYAPEDPECPSGLTLANNRLFFGGGQHDGAHTPGKFLWAVDPATGKELWKYQSHFVSKYSTDCFSIPAAFGDTVVVTTSNNVLALRASTGTLLWTGKSEGVSGGYPKPNPLSAPTIADGIVFAARSKAIESWNLAGSPLPPIPVDIGSDVDFTHLYADGATLFFLGDLASDVGSKPGMGLLHAMDIPTRKILWTHRVNREIRFLETWSTHEILVTPTAVYYENNSLIAKVAR
ncbi:MAG: PQQ-binding-like beta-propeller repeat protein [Terracidiphilus sp.]